MKTVFQIVTILIVTLNISCKNQKNKNENLATKTENGVKAKDILGNPDYLAISYGGYREKSRDVQPTIAELKEDMKILSAIGIKILRTYNVQLPHAANILKAIRELKKEDPKFEMYVMLGAWIDCKNAWTELPPDHNEGSEQNEAEIGRAVTLANKFPDIVKILAVGNEAMVRWAESYYVHPKVILKWVTHLQDLKRDGKLNKDLWITCSDDFASWGGGAPGYQTEDLEKIIKTVDYVSIHTYPYHNTHYNPEFWFVPPEEENLSEIQKIEAAIERAQAFAKSQYKAVSKYVKSVDSTKTIHIGETGGQPYLTGIMAQKGRKLQTSISKHCISNN